eukprot:SAG25_NODE_252_length_10970_cov_6.386349_2_plen_57_part_00
MVPHALSSAPITSTGAVSCPPAAAAAAQVRDQNRRDIGKSQSISADSTMETPGSLR